MGQVRIHYFLEKTKRKGKKGNKDEEKADPSTSVQEKLRKRVTDLLKKQKLPAVKQIVRNQEGLPPWGQDAKAKVCKLSSSYCHHSFLFLKGCVCIYMIDISTLAFRLEAVLLNC